MRCSFLGRRLSHDPVVIQFPLGASVFRPGDYLAQGYTTFDAIVIGAGGGHASGLIRSDVIEGRPINWAWGGGVGGGGGVHRVRGLLALLPSSIDAYVGRAGVSQVGTFGYETLLANLRAGGNGEASYFGSTAMASGGIGGRATTAETYSSSFRAAGGAGGLGGTRTAGGGGAGGTAASPNGVSGTWDGAIGGGGGGAASGVGMPPAGEGGSGPPPAEFPAGIGGRGSYNVGDTSVSDTTLYAATEDSGGFGVPSMEGGSGSGGRITALTGLADIAGTGGNFWRNLGLIFALPGGPNGVVALRLT